MNTQRIAILLTLCGLTVTSGCGVRDVPVTTSTAPTPSLPPVPAVMASEFSELTQSSEKPVLVEFSVTSGCFRCDAMRSQLQQLADDVKDQVQIVRMDFNANQSLAESLGATVCPSYVLFANGQPAWVQNYPTSSDLLSSRLSSELSPNSDPDSKLQPRRPPAEDGSDF